MSKFSNDLFLLMANLSQMQDNDRMIPVFTDAVNNIDPDVQIEYTESESLNDSPDKEMHLEVTTKDHSYGFYRVKGKISKKKQALLANSIQMLAVLIEKAQQDSILKQEKINLDQLVRKREKSLQENKELFRSIFEQAFTGIAITDRDGNFINTNNQFCQITGYRCEELKGLNFRDISKDDEFKKEEEEHINQVLAGDKDSFIIEKRYLHKEGFYIWIRVFSSVIRNDQKAVEYAVIVIEDITDKKSVETVIKQKNAELEQINQKLHQKNKQILTINNDLSSERKRAIENERIYKTFFDISKDGVIILLPDCSVRFANSSAAEIFKYPPEQIYELELVNLFSGEHAGLFLTSCNKILKGEDISFFAQGKTRANQLIWLECQGSQVLINNKKHIYLSIRDVTEQRMYQKRLLEAKEKAEESDRLKSAFLANMSHEIRTPMNGIVGFSKLLTETRAETEKKYKYTEVIEQCVDQLLTVVEDIITISSLETGQEVVELESVHPQKILQELKRDFKERAESRGIKLILDEFINEDLVVQSDTFKIKTILKNLIKNALKFTVEGYIRLGCAPKGSNIEFYIQDSGIGIRPEYHDLIFERFRQVDESTSRQFGGTGLGLSIVRGYTELLSGKINIESELNVGTTFRVVLPVYLEGTKKESFEVDVSDINPYEIRETDHTTVLIAEDEMTNFIYMKEVLKSLGFKIIHASNGQEALESVKEQTDIDMILMDMKMPLMDGVTATALIKKIKPRLPIIALAAYAFDGDKNKALAAGCDDYLIKPIHKDKLLEKIYPYIRISEE